MVTDISSTTLNRPGPLQYHANNALFYVPTSGPNAGVGFRFGNMPVESEGTGPYFSPDEQTLFLSVQHPGEATSDPASTIAYGDVVNYTLLLAGRRQERGTRPVAAASGDGGDHPLAPRAGRGQPDPASRGVRRGRPPRPSRPRHGHSRRDFFKRG